jgi:hypothetical protein
MAVLREYGCVDIVSWHREGSNEGLPGGAIVAS